MPLITISRPMGSLGKDIAMRLSDKLNYEYLDRDKIGEALADYGFPESELGLFEQKKPSWWLSFSTDKKKFLHFLRGVVYDFSNEKNAVILGLGAQVILKDMTNAFHVKINAPFDVRVKRIGERKGDDEMHVEMLLKQTDRDNSGWMRYLYDVDWNDISLYDTMINTEKVPVDTAVQMISEAIHTPELGDVRKKGKEDLADLIIVHKIEAKLMEIGGSGIQDYDIRFNEGVVTIIGTVKSIKVKEKIELKIAEVDGVKKLRNQLMLTPRSVA